MVGHGFSLVGLDDVPHYDTRSITEMYANNGAGNINPAKRLLDMERIKLLFFKVAKWEYTPLWLLTLVMLVLRFVIFAQVNALVFDKNYYVPAARSIVQRTGTDITQHPPLAQLLIA